jgi:hypothetical protein
LLSAGIAGAQLALETAAYLQLHASPAVSVLSAWSALTWIPRQRDLLLRSSACRRGIDTIGSSRNARQALRLELHAAELRTQLVRAQMSALKMQLQPLSCSTPSTPSWCLVRQQSAARAEEMPAA